MTVKFEIFVSKSCSGQEISSIWTLNILNHSFQKVQGKVSAKKNFIILINLSAEKKSEFPLRMVRVDENASKW